ncbi:MAG TPA: serine hydrolase [Pyrinomonadaceae bacterium]|nr:serine hydrolase [Pyrinomonadaceae bacterium]
MASRLLNIFVERPAAMLVLLFTVSLFGVQAGFAQNVQPAAAMDREMSAVYQPDNPGAAVVVVKNGQVIFRKAYGMANLELQVPMKPEMVFRLASVTKQFTAVAIMMLVEQGRLWLHDDLTKFFPDYPTAGRKITVENLLTHTSGIKDFMNKVWPERMSENLRPQQLIDLFKNDSLEFVPGAKEEYANANYILLGAIIEKLSGQDYAQFIEHQIFKALGMTHSSYCRTQPLMPNRVSGYLKRDNVYINPAYFSMTQLFAAGAICSSVDDLALWDAAISANKLLKPSSWDQIFTPYKLSSGLTEGYAYGWVISKFLERPMASHAGGIPGFRAYVMRIPGDRLYVALLSNDETADTQPEYVAKRIAAIALGQPLSEPQIIKLDPAVLESYVGQYSDGNDSFTIVRRGDRLFGQAPRDPEVELFAVSQTEFIIKAFDARVEFLKDANGRVTALVQKAGGESGTLKKVR